MYSRPCVKIAAEALFVGAYTTAIFLVIQNVLPSFLTGPYSLIVAFATGFVKHFAAHLLGIHGRYCRTLVGDNARDDSPYTVLIAESLFEGCLFVLLTAASRALFPKVHEPSRYFVDAALLHIAFEALGIHHRFCNSWRPN